ncbi:MAG: zf-HC2 domain-containing protein [Candidatus Eisenbacteria bacterium]|nr:zf-HC2 domain-containing protein [Candidatus Eisenbacteria bacterium]
MSEHWNDLISDYLDGVLATAERGAFEAHVAICGACARDLAALREVIARARALEGRAPDSDLWPSIRSRIEAADRARAARGEPALAAQGEPVLVARGEPSLAARAGRGAFRFALPRRVQITMPQTIAAGLALILLSGGAVWWAMRGAGIIPSGPGAAAPVSAARPAAGSAASLAALPAVDAGARLAAYEAHYDQAIADLERTLEQHRSTLDTSTVRVVEQNLAIIDRAILQARRALEADPASPYLHEHLALEMKLKLNLLRRAAAFSGARG